MDKCVTILFLLFILTFTSIQGSLYTNIIKYFTQDEKSPLHSGKIAQRYKRITPESDEYESNLPHGNIIPLIPKEADIGNIKGKGKFYKRSIEEEELDEILNHKNTNYNEDPKKKVMTRSVEEFMESVPNKPETKFLEQSATLKSSDDMLQSEQKYRQSRSKFENINSREEKEMSSIKTLSSLSVPAGKEHDQDGSASGENDESALTEVFNWPRGRYGLPKSIFGCPTTSGSKWKTGFRYHDTEDDGTENQRSDVFHLAANFSEDGISHEFCIKDDIEGEGDWPAGKYCIYKRGPRCPVGLKEGFVIWDDENTDNQDDKGGALPEGEYTEDTKIYFCCSTNGVTDSQISLPAKKPFFLFAYESIKCQKVLNMKATSEFIKFDDEDHGNTDYEEGVYPYGIHKFQKDHMLFLCYYEPSKTVVSYNSEPSLGTNLEEDATSSNEIDQESLRQSEEMMKAFMKATGGVEDNTNKKERTKTIIKTIKVPVRAKGSPVATVVGLILGSFVIGTAIIILAKHVNRRPNINNTNNLNRSLNHSVEASWPDTNNRGQFRAIKASENEANEDGVCDSNSDNESTSCYTVSEHDSWSDLEVDDELVEDQLLPDSELKSGLELLFLKQQRHYWNQKRRHEQRRDNSMDE